MHAPGLPCHAAKGAQNYCLAEIRELIDRGAEGISLDLTSHQVGFWSDELGPSRPNSLGFNPPLVEAYEKRYGVNVLKEEFDKPKWHALHGEFFTGFLQRVKAELGDKPLVVGATPEDFLGLGAKPVACRPRTTRRSRPHAGSTLSGNGGWPTESSTEIR